MGEGGSEVYSHRVKDHLLGGRGFRKVFTFMMGEAKKVFLHR